jgi:hypothetical protein
VEIFNPQDAHIYIPQAPFHRGCNTLLKMQSARNSEKVTSCWYPNPNSQLREQRVIQAKWSAHKPRAESGSLFRINAKIMRAACKLHCS